MRELDDLDRPPSQPARSRLGEALDIALILAVIALSGLARRRWAHRRASDRVDQRQLGSGLSSVGPPRAAGRSRSRNNP